MDLRYYGVAFESVSIKRYVAFRTRDLLNRLDWNSDCFVIIVVVALVYIMTKIENSNSADFSLKTTHWHISLGNIVVLEDTIRFHLFRWTLVNKRDGNGYRPKRWV